MGGRTIFIGDLHGCGDEFEDLLERLDARPGTDSILLAGDAFTRGPTPLKCWELIKATESVMVLGNHDVKLRKRLQRRLAGKPDHASIIADRRYTLDALGPVAGDIVAWLNSCPMWMEGEHGDVSWVLVHAGVDPEEGFEGTDPKDFLVLRSWPRGEDSRTGRRWHEFYEGPETIIFGHDALGGMIEKRDEDGHPIAIGLDTGCVYGGWLTAYILEEDRFVQVQSRQPRRVKID